MATVVFFALLLGNYLAYNNGLSLPMTLTPPDVGAEVANYESYVNQKDFEKQDSDISGVKVPAPPLVDEKSKTYDNIPQRRKKRMYCHKCGGSYGGFPSGGGGYGGGSGYGGGYGSSGGGGSYGGGGPTYTVITIPSSGGGSYGGKQWSSGGCGSGGCGGGNGYSIPNYGGGGGCGGGGCSGSYPSGGGNSYPSGSGGSYGKPSSYGGGCSTCGSGNGGGGSGSFSHSSASASASAHSSSYSGSW